jgi:hypothetical protein
MFKKMSGLIQVGEHPALFIYNILLSVIAKDRTPTTCAGIWGLPRSTRIRNISENAGDEFLTGGGQKYYIF